MFGDGLTFEAFTDIPAKHRIDGLAELGAARFINATGVHPEVLEVIPASLFSAEFYLLEARLVPTCAIHEVFECGFLAIRSLSMREYSIAWAFVIAIFH
jgi:hypothetical protein